MFEIYTPKAWFSIFGGSESLRIDDNGYIYTLKEATRVFGGNPCGKIEWSEGKIYGKDFANFTRAPIGYMKTDSDGVIEVYNDVPGFTAAPVLYIKKNVDNVGEVYTAENYLSVIRRDPCGYIKPMPVIGTPPPPPTPPTPPDPPPVDGKITSLIPAGVWVVLGIAIFLLFGEEIGEKLSNPVFVISWLGLSALMVVWARHNRKKKANKQANKQQNNARVTKPAPTPTPTPTPISYAHICENCGKTYHSQAVNPRVNLCNACKKAVKNGEIPQPTPNPQPKPADFALSCSQCGVTYYSAEATPAVKLCPVCKAVNVKKQEPKPQPQPTPNPQPKPTPKPAPQVDGTANFVQETNGKSVFACPFCGAKLAVPTGKGQLVIKCAKCAKTLSAKS